MTCATCGHPIGTHHDRALNTACAIDQPTQTSRTSNKRIPHATACPCTGFATAKLSTESDKGAA